MIVNGVTGAAVSGEVETISKAQSDAVIFRNI